MHVIPPIHNVNREILRKRELRDFRTFARIKLQTITQYTHPLVLSLALRAHGKISNKYTENLNKLIGKHTGLPVHDVSSAANSAVKITLDKSM